jgi:hypothetical protein
MKCALFSPMHAQIQESGSWWPRVACEAANMVVVSWQRPACCSMHTHMAVLEVVVTREGRQIATGSGGEHAYRNQEALNHTCCSVSCAASWPLSSCLQVMNKKKDENYFSLEDLRECMVWWLHAYARKEIHRRKTTRPKRKADKAKKCRRSFGLCMSDHGDND